MKKFKVYVTPTVKEDLRRYLGYVRRKLKNPLAAKSIAEDFRETKKDLSNIAGGIKDPDSKILLNRGLKRINFKRHNYFLLYRVNGSTVEITNMYHMLEDFENKLI